MSVCVCACACLCVAIFLGTCDYKLHSIPGEYSVTVLLCLFVCDLIEEKDEIAMASLVEAAVEAEDQAAVGATSEEAAEEEQGVEEEPHMSLAEDEEEQEEEESTPLSKDNARGKIDESDGVELGKDSGEAVSESLHDEHVAMSLTEDDAALSKGDQGQSATSDSIVRQSSGTSEVTSKVASLLCESDDANTMRKEDKFAGSDYQVSASAEGKTTENDLSQVSDSKNSGQDSDVPPLRKNLTAPASHQT